MLQGLQRSGGESRSSHEHGKVPWKGESHGQRSSMVKCGVSLSPASQRGQCRPSLSQGTARQTPTSWPSSRRDRTSCRGQVRAPSPAAPPGPGSWSGPRLGRGEGLRGESWNHRELRKQEASAGSQSLRQGLAVTSCIAHRCLLLETAPEGSLGHTEMGQRGGQARGYPSIPSSLGSCLVACPQSQLPSVCPLQTGRADQRFGTRSTPSSKSYSPVGAWFLPASCRCEHHLKAQARGHGTSQRRNMRCVRS